MQLLACVHVAAAAKSFDLHFHAMGVHRQCVSACSMFFNSRLGLQVCFPKAACSVGYLHLSGGGYRCYLVRSCSEN